jgi:hypothetical protein
MFEQLGRRNNTRFVSLEFSHDLLLREIIIPESNLRSN